jgi:hypothetical protein
MGCDAVAGRGTACDLSTSPGRGISFRGAKGVLDCPVNAAAAGASRITVAVMSGTGPPTGCTIVNRCEAVAGFGVSGGSGGLLPEVSAKLDVERVVVPVGTAGASIGAAAATGSAADAGCGTGPRWVEPLPGRGRLGGLGSAGPRCVEDADGFCGSAASGGGGGAATPGMKKRCSHSRHWALRPRSVSGTSNSALHFGQATTIILSSDA